MKKFLLRNLKTLFFLLSVLITILSGMLFGVILVYQRGFPNQIKNLEDIKPVVMTTVFDDQSGIFKEFAIEKRIIVKDADIPDILKKALITAEDNQFYAHWGINFKGVIRAIWGVLTNQRRGGGSSITQQLSRGLFLTPEVTMSRKMKEMLLAIQIEKRYTKDQILTFYCNKIFFGGSVYGVGAATQYYFGKFVKDINATEAALLASIIPNPNGLYSVFQRPENCLRRRNQILWRMLKFRFISQKEYDEALRVPLPLRPYDVNKDSLADYFAEETRKYLEAKYGDNILYKGGLRVYTTLNRDMQKWARESLCEGLRAVDKRRGWRSKIKLYNVLADSLDAKTCLLDSWKDITVELDAIVEGIILSVNNQKIAVRIRDYLAELTPANASWVFRSFSRIFKPGDVAWFRILTMDGHSKKLTLSLEQEPEVEGAIMVIDNKTGEIKAMVGGYDFERSQFNRAIQAYRQTGSTFKPIIYTAALENGFTAATIVEDTPFSYVDEWTGTLWEPRNHQGDYKGPITLRRALEQSRNAATARILYAITPQTGVDYARKFGITSNLQPYMSLALGSFEVTLKEMVEAFSVFPNYGMRVNSFFIKKIADTNNNTIEENFPEKKQVLSQETAFLMNYLLQGVIRSGTGWRARDLPAPIGGKTGTPNDYTDAWFIGFTPTITVGVWVGLDQKKSLGFEETGAKAASPIFVGFMEKYLARYPELNKFRVPPGLLMVEVDKFTGKLFTPDCVYRFKEAFLPGTEPLEYCTEEDHAEILDYYKIETDTDDD